MRSYRTFSPPYQRPRTDGTLVAVSLRRASALLVLPALVAACGSSKSPSTTSTPATTTVAAPSAPLTQSQFVSDANQVCIKADGRIYKLGRLTRNPLGWAKTAAAARLGITQMQAITPPAAKRTAFMQMLAYGRQFAASIQKVHDNLVAKKYDAAIAAQFAAARLQDHVHAEAKLAGLTFCQQNLTNWPG
jgi:hypothetical protein